MAKKRRIDYTLVTALYENNYGQVAIGKMLESPHGHISKVLRKEGVVTRERGKVVQPVPFPKMSKDDQAVIMKDEDFFKVFQEFTGYKHVVEKKKKENKPVSAEKGKKKVVKRKKMDGWDDMTTEEKGEIIQNKLEEGKSSRKVAEEIGIGQSTLIGIRNMYLYGSRTKPVNA